MLATRGMGANSRLAGAAPRLPSRGGLRPVTPGWAGPGGPGGRGVATQALGATLVSTAAAAVGAWLLSQQMALEQDQMEAGDSGINRRPCPGCGGSGVEACMCQRWSDGDAGCGSCNRTGVTSCRYCRGGGTAVPIKVTIRKDL
ncbi:hypothetical protein HT031_000482 [Scenedesmus sp. PABB004]|nr:hypothetical protein HT031_000482 [Scenedesmus sp. PABB004]